MNIRDSDDRKLLSRVAETESIRKVVALLEMGADPNPQDNEGQTLLACEDNGDAA